MYEILLPIPNDDVRMGRLVSAVEDLPVRTEAVSVTLLYVFEELETEFGGTVSLREYSDVPDVISEARERFERTDVPVEALVAEGNAEEVIVSVADDRNVDHVAVAGRERSPTGKALFGSVTQSVVLNADVPVTVVPESVDEEGAA
ncbi:universal stress protein [Halomicrobium urmianum]|uniref:universal stress protein n=1 Tax=Halomicrobium urmianum TaxID=1586233 RepID=UPI0035712ED9